VKRHLLGGLEEEQNGEKTPPGWVRRRGKTVKRHLLGGLEGYRGIYPSRTMVDR